MIFELLASVSDQDCNHVSSQLWTLVLKKTIFAKMLQNSCNQYNFCKILIKNTYLARLVNLKVNLAKFLQQSCTTFSFAKILQGLCFLNLSRNAFFVRILKFSAFCIKTFLPCIEPTRNGWVLNRLIDSIYIYVEENTKLRKVSDMCSAITKTFWTKLGCKLEWSFGVSLGPCTKAILDLILFSWVFWSLSSFIDHHSLISMRSNCRSFLPKLSKIRTTENLN